MNKFNIYYGGITKLIPDAAVTLQEAHDIIIKDSLKECCEQIQAINNPIQIEQKKERNKIKKLLPYITPAGIFTERRNKCLVEKSGYAPIDIDYIEDVEKVKDQLSKDPYVSMAFISPSGAGIKVIIKIASDSDYKLYVASFYDYLHTTYDIKNDTLDRSTHDIARACFLGYDPKAYLNLNAKVFNKIIMVDAPKKKDTSRSAKEYREVLKLLYSGYDKQTIYKKMEEFDKWKTSPESYQNYTFQKAESYMLDNPPSTADKKSVINELAERILDSKYIYTLRSIKEPSMYIYHDGIYIDKAHTYIQEFVYNSLGKYYDKAIAEKVKDKIQVQTYVNGVDFYKEEDARYICVQNGILDIFERKLLPFSPDKKFFNKLPVTFKEDAVCEVTHKHFNTILPPQDVLVVQELYGYLLYRDYEFEKAFLFFGGGRNGKGKTIEQMKCLLGAENCANISLQDLQEKTFMKSFLHGKLANLGTELGNATLKDTTVFKELTGHDQITADKKHADPIIFMNYAKMIYSTNNIPRSVDDSEGFWGRWIPISFDVTFRMKNVYEQMEKDGTLKPNHRIADTEIIKKLTTPTELSGVLNWALDGLDRLRANKGFSRADSYDKVRSIIKRETSSAIAFLQDEVEMVKEIDAIEQHDTVYRAYLSYCLNATDRTKIETDRNFKQIFQDEGIPMQKKRVGSRDEAQWCYIKLKNGIAKKMEEFAK